MDTPKHEYIAFCKNESARFPIFYQPEWLDLISEGRQWDVALSKDKMGKINALWPYILYKKFIYNFIFNPVFTPNLGPILFYPENMYKTESILSFEKKTISNLIDQLPTSHSIVKLKLHPSLSNWLPLYWKGFEQTTAYTYQIHLAKDKDLSTQYTTSLRADLKKVPEYISFEKSEDASVAYDLSSQSYTKQDSVIYYSKHLFLQIDKLLKQSNNRSIFVAKRDQEVIAAIYIFYDRDTAYLPMIGRGNIQSNEDGVVKKLIDLSINEACNRASIYDFEGSMFPQFEKVFRAYGSIQTPYHVVSLWRNKLLRKIIV